MLPRLRPVAFLIAVLLSCTVATPLRAEEPPHYTFAPKPPGTILQSQVVYLAGQAMHSQWRAVVSKKPVGKGSQTFYQWYLSIYQIDGTTYHLRYQSPQNGGPISTVEKAHGAQMWFPFAEVRIIGAAVLTQPGVENLVVQTHESSADCGGSTVTVFGLDQTQHVEPVAQAKNPCSLTGTITHTTSGIDTLELSGPYYAKDAALCCPTKPKATARLHYMDGKWMLTPSNIFALGAEGTIKKP